MHKCKHTHTRHALRARENKPMSSHDGYYEAPPSNTRWWLWCALIVCGLGTVSFVGVTSFTNYVYKPYMTFYEQRAELVEEALLILNDPESNCNRKNASELRLKTRRLDNCPGSRKIAKSSPMHDAWMDYCEYAQFCKAGECIVFSFNVFQYMGMILYGIIVSAAIIVLIVGCCIANMCYRNLQMHNTLPRFVKHVSAPREARGKQGDWRGEAQYLPVDEHEKYH